MSSLVLYMVNHLVTAIERFVAVLNRARVWSISLVSSQVVIAIPENRKFLLTYLAPKRSFTGMGPKVNCNVGFQPSPEKAFLARLRIGPGARVL